MKTKNAEKKTTNAATQRERLRFKARHLMRRVQRFQHELRAQMRRHRPADDFARPDNEYNRRRMEQSWSGQIKGPIFPRTKNAEKKTTNADSS